MQVFQDVLKMSVCPAKYSNNLNPAVSIMYSLNGSIQHNTAFSVFICLFTHGATELRWN